MLGHKTSLNKFKKIKNTSSIFSDHNDIKLEINYKKKTGTNHKYVEIKQQATKKPMGQWRNWDFFLNTWDKWKWKYNLPNSMGCSKSSSKRKVHSNTVLPQETNKQKSQINNLIFHLKELEIKE